MKCVQKLGVISHDQGATGYPIRRQSKHTGTLALAVNGTRHSLVGNFVELRMFALRKVCDRQIYVGHHPHIPILTRLELKQKLILCSFQTKSKVPWWLQENASQQRPVHEDRNSNGPEAWINMELPA